MSLPPAVSRAVGRGVSLGEVGIRDIMVDREKKDENPVITERTYRNGVIDVLTEIILVTTTFRMLRYIISNDQLC